MLSGMTYLEHLQDNLRTYSPLEPLTDEDREFLEQTAQLLLRYPTVPCNDCQYCMPCPVRQRRERTFLVAGRQLPPGAAGVPRRL